MSVELTISVESVEEPIRGTIGTADGSVRRPFRGWLDLAAALEAVLAAHTGSAAPDVGVSSP